MIEILINFKVCLKNPTTWVASNCLHLHENDGELVYFSMKYHIVTHIEIKVKCTLISYMRSHKTIEVK